MNEPTVESLRSRDPESSEGSAPPAPALPSEDSESRLRGASRLTKLVAIALIAVAGFALWYFAIHDSGPKDDLGRMQGEWKITMPGEETAPSESRPPNFIRIEGDCWTYVSAGRETSSWRMTLNASASPREIDLTRLDADGQPVMFTHGARKGAEVKQLGVYSIDGDTMKVTLAPVLEGRPNSNDGDLPTLTFTRVGK